MRRIKKGKLPIFRLKNSRKVLIPVLRIDEVSLKLTEKAPMLNVTKDFWRRKGRTNWEYSENKDSSYYRFVDTLYKRTLRAYMKVVMEKLLQGHTIVLPHGIAEVGIHDYSKLFKNYNIQLNGQSPVLKGWVNDARRKERIQAKGFDYADVIARKPFSKEMRRRIKQEGYKYSKTTLKRKDNGQYKIHKPQNDTYVTGANF